MPRKKRDQVSLMSEPEYVDVQVTLRVYLGDVGYCPRSINAVLSDKTAETFKRIGIGYMERKALIERDNGYRYCKDALPDVIHMLGQDLTGVYEAIAEKVEAAMEVQ